MTDYSRDQGAVDWARAEVEKVIAWCRENETKRRAAGNEEYAMRYRFAANVMEMQLTATGCVVSAFSEHGPGIRHLLDGAE